MRRLPIATSARARKSRKVLLVQPGRGELWGVDFAYRELLPHVGLAYVAAAVRAAGHETQVIDALAEGLGIRDVVARARSFEPEVVAFTANSTQMAAAAGTASAFARCSRGR